MAGGLNLYGFAGGDPVNFSDPFGLWDVAAHEKILDHALGKIASTRQMARFKSASVRQDVWHNWDNQRHYLADRGQSATAARARAEAYISNEISAAQGARKAGDEDGAATHLGNALHGIADGTSPAHVDDLGNPKEYPGPGHSACDRCGGTERSQDLTQAVYDKNDQRMRQAYYQVYPEAKP